VDPSTPSLADLLSLSGKVAIVTGAARGIGLACARRLSEAGADVVLADVDDEAARKAAASVAGPGAASALRVDVTVPASVRSAAETTRRERGHLDIWVNNAGVYPSTVLADVTVGEWDSVLDVNLRGMFLGAQTAAALMTEGGVIINIASTSAHGAFGPGMVHYTSSKHGVIGLTKALAVELGPRGIRVLSVSPTLTMTEGIRAAATRFADSGMKETLDALAGQTPLRRVAAPDDIARVVLFAASGLAAFVSGSDIAVDGGLLAVG
jgi:NAD(P)-dependent dehydrogenase (short-subunit alcohol dehydrogenase family)